jgi:hypothetical protein
MGINRPLLLFLALFSCYLVFSLAFVSAYSAGEALSVTGDARRAKFVMEPVLRIADDLQPLSCDSSGVMTFRAYVENVAEFNITAIQAFVEDAWDERYYDISSALTCSPDSGVISNEEVTCRLNLREMLSRLPSCPFEKTENTFYLSFDISSVSGNDKVTASKSLVLAGPDVKPGMDIDFYVSSPPYPLPEINCRTGSEIDVPVVIHNAETLSGGIAWSFAVNGTPSNVIECAKMLSRSGGGRDDIYLCTLSIPDTVFRECEEGSEVLVAISAESGGKRLSGNFSAPLSSSELVMSLQLSQLPTLECQIIDNENGQGTCVPKEPQQNVTATIISNVADKLKVFEARYKLGDEDVTTTLCEKISEGRYQCTVFVTIDKLPVPPQKNDTSTKQRDLSVFFDIKYLNYYRNISASTKVTLEGKTINEIINTQNVLKQKKGFLEWLIKSNFQGILQKALRVMNFVSRCCEGLDLADTFTNTFKKAKMKAIEDAVLKYVENALWGNAKSVAGRIMETITRLGPNTIKCIVQKGIEDISKEMQKLQTFEEGKQIPANELEVPSIGDVTERYLAGCLIGSFWQSLKSGFWGLLCGIVLKILSIWPPAGAVIRTACTVVNSEAFKDFKNFLNMISMAADYLVLLNTIITATKAMALARERINVQMNATHIMSDYQSAFSQTIESTTMEMYLNAALSDLVSPYYPTVKLYFNSSRIGVLDSGGEICSGDRITLSYDFEKLNQTAGFVPELFITNSHSKILLFDSLNGTYGPIDANALLGIDDPAGELPEEEYTFTLRYEDKYLNYKLKYVNHECA